MLRVVGVVFLLLVVILGRTGPAVTQECSGNPINGFVCTKPISNNLAVGPVFSASGALRPSPGLLKKLREEKGEKTGGGASADDARFGLFANGSAAFKDMAEERTLGSDSDIFGGVVGADYTGDAFFASVALDYSNENTNFDHNAGKTEINEFGVRLLGTAYPIGNLYVTGATRLAYDNYDTRRNITDDSGSTVAKGSPEGYKFSASGGAGYDFTLPMGFGVGLAASLNYQRTYVDSYKENGAEPVTSGNDSTPNLRYDDDGSDSLTSVLELNATKAFSVPWGVLIPGAVFQYLHEFADDPRTIKAQVIDQEGVVDNGVLAQSDIRYRTDRPNRNYFNLGASVTSVFPQGWALFVNYSAIVGNNLQEEQVVTLGVRTDLDSLRNLF
jgi:outer membrane lipase/esterase